MILNKKYLTAWCFMHQAVFAVIIIVFSGSLSKVGVNCGLANCFDR
jgi:hypothetical protein